MLRRIAASLLILIGAGSTLVINRPADGPQDHDFAIYAEPVLLAPRDPARRDVGRLRYLGGWILRSDDPSFGGISAMALDGGEFIAVGDAGGLFRFTLNGAGTVINASIGALPAGPLPDEGEELQKRDRDAESMVHDPVSGRYWVGFERANGFWRYSSRFDDSDINNAPEAMEEWPANGGPEAMVRLTDGRFLVFSEAGDGPRDSREVLLFPGDPSIEANAADPIRLGYRPPNGYRITDAALLPDGRLIVLNRSFNLVEGVSVIVTRVSLDPLEEGSILTGEIIARLDPPLTVDNMEALAIAQRDGRTIIWMASDDNLSRLQRTLLLQFELMED